MPDTSLRILFSRTLHSSDARNARRSNLRQDNSLTQSTVVDMMTDANKSQGSSHPRIDNMHSLGAGGAGAASALPFHTSTASEDVQVRKSAGTCSATPNARASRLFRERRKEREKVLRDTVAELAERNIALESLLLSHGITPPREATLKKELAIHRSQNSGGPPIHIPGLTSVRPLPIESTDLQCVVQDDVHPFQGVHQPLSSSTLTGFCSGERSYGSNFHASSETSYSSDASLGISSSLLDSSSRTVSSEHAFCDMLQTHAAAISPTYTAPMQRPHQAGRMRPLQLTNTAIAGSHAPLTSSPDGSTQISSTLTRVFEPFGVNAAAGWTPTRLSPQLGSYQQGASMSPNAMTREAASRHLRSPSDHAVWASTSCLIPATRRMSTARPDLLQRHSLHAFMTDQEHARQDFISWDHPTLYQPFHGPEQQVAHPREASAQLQPSDVGMSANADASAVSLRSPPASYRHSRTGHSQLPD
ncbi:transcription factor [Pseudozyma hubeiensis SY62]|uniref:Transcription factor n=1 Tax=Pseudozyma hubeiensis (strain SY62) TaxID=1305764 RepID=R9PAM4_PSEHS|nr:transcription factor [Pseudozyma hubeiensis SY62]GAC98416.1 transcription factor [Pseudozyma hubeiensis SY62]